LSQETSIRRLIAELRRRRVFRTAALYIVSTWLLLQVADVVFPALDIPERAIRFLLFAALLGFPAALVFGWFYDVGVHGIRRTGPADPSGEPVSLALRRTDFLILTALVVVVGAIVYNAVGNVVETPGQVQQVSRDGPPMVAVLPFVSKALEGESEFFAVGVHDDLLTQLAQLQSIRVISRTSVMEFKDTIRNIREIGRALGADAILEGGVQSAGNRIRINAQLIDARTDEHLWAQTYDRELSAVNIFDVQSEIARAISSAMRTTLTEQDSSQLAVVPTENMAAYRAYHRAMAIRDNDRSSLYDDPAYREALQEAVTLDPTFTRAWAELAGNLSFQNYFYERSPELTEQAEEAVERIRVLAPNSADHLMAQAYFTYYALKDYDRAFRLVSDAHDMVPSDTRLLELKTWIQRRLGDFEGRVETARLGRKLDPRDPQWAAGLVNTLGTLHRYDEVRAELENTEIYDASFEYWRKVLAFEDHGDWDQWISDQYALADEFGDFYREWQTWELHIAARDFEAAESMLPGIRGREDSEQPGLSPREAAMLMTFWMQGREVELQELLARVRPLVEKEMDANGYFKYRDLNLDMSLIESVEGNAEGSARYIRRWFAAPDMDWTTRSMESAYACQDLGMAGATAEAVRCIREAMDNPSTMIPFVEYHLPYYDPIRNEPEFAALVDEIDSSGTD